MTRPRETYKPLGGQMRDTELDLDSPESEDLLGAIAALLDDPDIPDSELRKELRALLFDDDEE